MENTKLPLVVDCTNKSIDQYPGYYTINDSNGKLKCLIPLEDGDNHAFVMRLQESVNLLADIDHLRNWVETAKKCLASHPTHNPITGHPAKWFEQQ